VFYVSLGLGPYHYLPTNRAFDQYKIKNDLTWIVNNSDSGKVSSSVTTQVICIRFPHSHQQHVDKVNIML
jgi:hypothetical protein